MTVEELTNILDSLLILPAETEVVEFKRAERNFDDRDLGQYFSALSNEANLKGRPCAWLVFGVENHTHEVVGRQPVQEQPSGARRNEEKDCRSDYGSAYVRRDT